MDSGGTVTLQVSNIPPYLREEEFSRFCMSWEGCTGSRLQQTTAGLKGYVDFSSTAAAQQACNLYNGWQGWGPRGLSLELLSSSAANAPQPQTNPQPALQPTTGLSGVDATKDVTLGGGTYQPMIGMTDQTKGGFAQMGVQQTAATGLQAQPQQQQLAAVAAQQRNVQQQQTMLTQQQQGTVMAGGMQAAAALPYQQSNTLAANTAMGNGQGLIGGAIPAAANTLNVQQILQQAQNPQQQQMMLPNTVQPQSYVQSGMTQQQQLLLAMQNAGGTTPMTGVGVTPMGAPTPHPMISNTAQNSMTPSQMQMLPKDAADTLFCEGLPNDATEREVSHIFRPFEGFKEVRLIQRENKQQEDGKVTLGFFEFKNAACANAALNVIQGYLFDQKDPNYKLKLSFAKYSTKRKGGGGGGGWGDQNRMDRANRSNKRKNRDDR